MRWFLLILPLFLSVACDRGAGSSASTRQANERFVRTMNEGHGLMGRFEFAAARNAFDKALALKPDSIDAMLDVAIARLNEVDPNAQEEAIERFARVLAVDPDQLGAHYCTGLAHLYLGRPLDARPHFELVARERPYDAHVAYFLAQALEQGGDPDAALESYRRAEQLDPFLRSSALGIQRTLSRMGDESGAADALKRFEDMAGNPRSRLAEFKYSRMGDLAMVTLPVRRGARLRASQDSDSVDPATDVLRAFEKMELVLDRKSSGEGSIDRKSVV